MFSKKRLEEQAETINHLQQEIRKLRNNIQQVKQENIELKKELESVMKQEKKMFNGLELTDEQCKILDLLEYTNNNYFITGRAGTGKSTILNCFRTTTGKKGVAIVAPTGAAAINVNGATIHSLFRMDLEPQDTWSKTKVKTIPPVLEVLKAVNVLIIDEVSMVRADIMDMIDARLRLAKKNELPFGGCQVIAFGDLYQLSPIAADREERDFILNRYNTLYFFGAPNVKKTFQIVELKEVLRQKDNVFIDLLNKVRNGSISDAEIQYINNNCGGLSYPDEYLKLTLTKEVAKKINIEKLSQINGKEYKYEIELGGNEPPKAEDIPCDFDLYLKIGSRIMLTRNDPANRYVNGSIGVITKLSSDSIQVSIDGEKYDIEPAIYLRKKYHKNWTTGELEAETVGWAKQYPVRLAYAITVHKSQGQTYDNVVIDYRDRNAFAAGQTYVALSRCKTLKGIYLSRPLTRRDIHVDKDVLTYMNGEYNSAKTTSIEKQNSQEEHAPTVNYASTKVPWHVVDEYPF